MVHVLALDFEEFIDLGYKLISLMESHAAPSRLTVAKSNESRDRLHSILAGKLRILVNINLDDICFVTNRILHLFEYGSLHLAWSAPCGIKVDQSRF